MSHEWAEPWRTPSRRPIVKVEEPAESLAAMNATGAPPRKHRIDEFIADTLTPGGVLRHPHHQPADLLEHADTLRPRARR
ncbi:MAG: hypothetical protein DMF92_16395 [Acidobacteria bacterium]|nr:MAG: hypothetical protein DMF92_16395 [Acidobacteriota bacterium]